MLRSMYSGVSGMKNFQVKLDVIGNNISNVNTIGFKKSSIQFQDLLSQTVSTSGANPMQVGLGSGTASLNVNHNPGSAISTGVATDLTIMGDGFFVVESEASGERYLTRAGSFTLDSEGFMTTAQGYNVLDTQGNPVQITPPGSDFSIDRLGNIVQENGPDPAIQIGMFAVDNPTSLRKVGGSMYELSNEEEIVISDANAIRSQIGSGLLEMSNIDLTEEFTEMIIAQRGFQANSRTITTSDEVLQEVVNLKR